MLTLRATLIDAQLPSLLGGHVAGPSRVSDPSSTTSKNVFLANTLSVFGFLFKGLGLRVELEDRLGSRSMCLLYLVYVDRKTRT